MDLAGVAAVVGLMGIPVTVVIARWQLRSALDQAQLAYRAAIEAAEAAHRTALQQAEAAHRTALEVAHAQIKADHDKWLEEAQRTSFHAFQSAVGRFRRKLEEGANRRELLNTASDLHDLQYELSLVCPEELSRLARNLYSACRFEVLHRIDDYTTHAERVALYDTMIKPLRVEITEFARAHFERRQDPSGS
ncbi:hypothetical protein [Streptomyces sp. NK08204]|uniref:hypothetical protein n=1 Tax=Streptomyces sp. NK08204 TaxID=2873260 RepID=UPI001CED5E44|nr:hypothetical protein [Streptomyces sp. NK08204]